MFRRHRSSHLSFGGRTLHEEESGRPHFLRTTQVLVPGLVFSRLCALGAGAQLSVLSKNLRASCKINTYKFESLKEINKQMWVMIKPRETIPLPGHGQHGKGLEIDISMLSLSSPCTGDSSTEQIRGVRILLTGCLWR